MRTVVLAAVLTLMGCDQPKTVAGADDPNVTLIQYNQIREGMTYEQVVAVLGSQGVEQSSSNVGGTRTVMYAWNGNTLGGNMNAMFQNGQLVQKAQFGLE